jgi:hypothetical protein
LQHLDLFNCLLPVNYRNFNRWFAKVILKHQTFNMNSRFLLLALAVAAFSSCSSVYKSGQTPDDVYFSPARPQAESYVEVRKEKPGSNYQTYEQYQDSYRDDNFLRMSVGNPYYLNAYNSYSGFDWRYNSFYNGFNYGYNSPWNNYFAWNNFYNPYGSPYLGYSGYYGGGYGGGYYGGGYGGGVKFPVDRAPISRPVVFNVNSYNGNNTRPVSRNYTGNSSTGNSYYNNTNQRYNNNNSGNSNRSYYNNNSSSNHPANTGSSSSNNTYTPSRSYTPSSTPSSSPSSSGGSGGGGGVSRPSRGN